MFVPAVGDRDSDDLRQNASSPNPFPPEFYLNFLANQTILQKNGAQAQYSECSNRVDAEFSRTGDDARTLLPQLAALANSRLKILIWVSGAFLAWLIVAVGADWVVVRDRLVMRISSECSSARCHA